MSATGTLNPPAHKYLDLWVKHIAEGLGSLTGARVAAEPVAEESSQAAEAVADGVWVRLFAGEAGEQAFFLGAADALRLSQLLLGGSPDETATLTPEGKEAVVQFFQQIATMIPMTDWLGFAGEIEASEEDLPQWESAGQAAFRFS